ncbi:MAG: YHS domain-containing protein [Deltaproteobacteria bacterium]|nr:MAG: YHS domain-containing protein [Deltaproteobacteria bacterium]TMQ20773.1 MAG: YHS domain-containing protein [Deltaproteobacteria bacterium]
MNKQLLERAAELARRGESFVFAVVVRREPYSSSQQGDAAIITADGSYHGWLGGNCTRPQVLREAAQALVDGKPRLIALSPEPEAQVRAGVTPLPMTCHSGGTVDIFLEPVLAAPRLVVFGVSPVARAVAQLGKAMGYLVDVVDPDGDAAHAAALPGADRVFVDLAAAELRSGAPIASAVVASMGEHDEDAVAAALAMRPAYLGVVASRKRFAVLRQTLLDRGVSAHALDAIKSPAGLDLGGRQPEEVALSILAEIVQLKHARPADQPAPVTAVAAATAPTTAIDPVCHMTVTIATARHVGTWDGRTWYFCNPRCKDKFLADPGRYLEPPSAGAAR